MGIQLKIGRFTKTSPEFLIYYALNQNDRIITTFETTASHQSSTAAKECDSPTANGVTEHEKLTSHVFNLHPHIILHNKASTTTTLISEL